MNKQELIEKYEYLNHDCFRRVDTSGVLKDLRQLDEPQPLKLKDIISRMKQLFPNNRSEWIDEILKEFGEEFGSIKYRSGYEQGKLEGTVERDKVAIPQFVADWIEECGTKEKSLLTAILYTPEKVNSWVGDSDNQELFARAWLDGYTIEEKRYKVKMKAIKSNSQYLIFGQLSGTWWFGSAEQIGNVKSEHTRKQLEEAGFGEVFNSPLFEVKEVE